MDTEGNAESSPARLALLLDASTAVASATSFRSALKALAAEAVPRLADLCLIDVLMDGGRIERLAGVHHDRTKAELVAELERNYEPRMDGPHPVSAVIKTGRSVWSATVTADFLHSIAHDERHFEIVRALDFTSFMSVPLIAGEELIGVMTLVSAGSGRRFQEADLALPEELAQRVSQLVREIRGHDRNRYIARALQARLLPRHMPEVPGMEIAHRYLTGVRDIDVGGDFYDLVMLPSTRLGVAVGDVAGHDPDAAALMGQLRSAIRALAGQIREPGPLVDALQWSWELLGFDRISTLFVARIDPGQHHLVAVSAGHPPPVAISTEGRAEFLTIEPGAPLGCPSGPAKEFEFDLEPGGLLVLYTDGLAERRNEPVSVGLERLLRVCHGLAALSVEAAADKIIQEMLGDRELEDDAALLVLRILA